MRKLTPPFVVMGLLLLVMLFWLFRQPSHVRAAGLQSSRQQLTAQLLLNPDFEGTYHTPEECPTRITGALAEGWDDNSCGDGNSVIIYAADSTNAHHGLAAQRIQVVQGEARLVQFLATPTFQADQQYSVTIWLRAARPMYVELQLRQTNYPYTAYASKLVNLSSTWTQFTLRGVTESTAGMFIIYASSPGTFWVDDASLSGNPAPNWTPPISTIPRGYFGMHLHASDTPWPAVGNAIGAIRLWGADGKQGEADPWMAAHWARINTAAGVYNWEALDAHVARAQANNADVLLTLALTPRWASARPDEPAPGFPSLLGSYAEPAHIADWQAWVQAVATRYQGKIRYWEIWNEPDLHFGFYTGTPQQLKELACTAYTILKQVDPANQVLTPSAFPAYLDYYLSIGGGDCADIISTHFYIDVFDDVDPAVSRPEKWAYQIPNLRLLLAQYGLQDKPLWNTEAGWLFLDDTHAPLSQTLGAGYLARAYLLNWAYGATRYYYYAWDEGATLKFPLVTADGQTLTPTGTAYREIANWLTGARMTARTINPDGVWAITITRPDGTPGYILWHPEQSVSFAIPAQWQVQQQRDLLGKVTSLTGVTRVAVSVQPLLLEQTTLPVALPAPTALQALALSDTKIQLSWQDQATTESGFQLERCIGDGCTNFVLVATVKANVVQYTNPKLGAAIYCYRVRAYNASTTSAYSTVACTPTLPTAPKLSSLTTISERQITLRWSDRSAHETGFAIERCQASQCTNFAPIATVAANETSYQDTTLVADSYYRYRVRAYNSGGNSAYSALLGRRTGPNPPGNLSATVTAPTQITLRWLDGSTTESGFRIERCTGTTCNTFTQIATVKANITQYDNKKLTPNTTYCYRIYSYTTDGPSSYTLPVCTVTPVSAAGQLPGQSVSPDTLPLAGGSLSATTTEIRYTVEAATGEALGQSDVQTPLALRYQPTCPEGEQPAVVELWVNEQIYALEEDPNEENTYTTTLSIDEQFAGDSSYALEVRWQCAGAEEPFVNADIGILHVISPAGSFETAEQAAEWRFYVPLITR